MRFASLAATTPPGQNVFDDHPLLIARMDQLARGEELLHALDASRWDLVIVDEAHRRAARYAGPDLRKTARYELGEHLGGIARTCC
jgi:hypothetical protein